MTRRTVLTALTGLTLAGALAGPAAADDGIPVLNTEADRTSVCLRADPNRGEREGYCVWLPVAR